VLDSITKTPLDGARSVAAVLHGRAGKEPAPARGNTVTWAERVPGYATPDVREFFTERDRRQAEEGEQLAANPPRWALEAWGVPPKEPGPLRDDWMQRAAVVGSYRELAGITDPAVAIGPPPARQAGMSEAFAASVRALGLPDEAAMLKAMGRGELTAQVREFARAQAAAPADVRLQVDLTDRARERYAGQAKAARQARVARTELGEAVPPHAVDATLTAYRDEGRRLAAAVKAAELVERAAERAVLGAFGNYSTANRYRSDLSNEKGIGQHPIRLGVTPQT